MEIVWSVGASGVGSRISDVPEASFPSKLYIFKLIRTIEL